MGSMNRKNFCASFHDNDTYIGPYAYLCPCGYIHGRCTITICSEKLLGSITCVKDKSQTLHTVPLRWNVIIPVASFLSHQREYPKAISASHCSHHVVKLWSSLRLKPCQYKSSKMLSGVCCLISLSLCKNSVCSTSSSRENILKPSKHCRDQILKNKQTKNKNPDHVKRYQNHDGLQA